MLDLSEWYEDDWNSSRYDDPIYIDDEPLRCEADAYVLDYSNSVNGEYVTIVCQRVLHETANGIFCPGANTHIV